MVARAVFLDRDGVLNENVQRDGRPVAPSRAMDFRVLPGVPEGVRRLKAAGFLAIVVTNQPDVAAGRTPWSELDAMHADLRRRVSIDDIRVCPHVDADGCACRKPKPGLVLEAAADHGVDLRRSYLVGDRWRDIDAGRAAGCCTIVIASDEQIRAMTCQPDFVARSLAEAVDVILRREALLPTAREGAP